MTAVLYPGWGISLEGGGFVVTEEFRTHTVLTLLASLGGLWTILSALFDWLFGRSLLFPVFGKNLFCFSLIPFLRIYFNIVRWQAYLTIRFDGQGLGYSEEE